MNKKEWTIRLVGATSGLLLTIPHIWMIAAPLQLVALIPVLYLASQHTVTYRKMIVAGVYMGIFYVLPQAVVLRMPLVITLILFVELTVLFFVFAVSSHYLLRKCSIISAFAIGASLVLMDWLNFTAVPLWGMAQSIVRPWSGYPGLISFVCVTGLTGIVFLLGTSQGLIVNIAVYPKKRIMFISTIAALIFPFVAINLILQAKKPADKIKISAVGWKYNGSEGSDGISYPEDANSLYARLVRRAAGEGSKLVVSPELGFSCWDDNVDNWLRNFQDIAQQNKISLAFGYESVTQNENRVVFIGSDGEILGHYTKTHLTPFEDFKRGNGVPVIISIDGVNVGAMICHDDNFTDISRRYGREGVSLLAVPTMDWATVKNAHLQSSISRAIESNYAVIRASINGVSAIISPKGEVLARMDHLIEGQGIITAEVPLYSGRTVFSVLGHWPVVPCFVFLLIYLAGDIRSRIRPGKRTPDLEI